MKANKTILDQYVAERKLRVGKHPTKDLFIYNYTKHTEYNNLWDDITRTARGLVVDSDGYVYARPFEKFFNLEQHDPETIKGLEGVEFEVFEKMDGFLGIGFMHDGEFIISSRGSFESRPAMVANKIWKTKYAPYLKPYENYTYIFEIIYPEDKIIVDYDFEDLVLLGINLNEGLEMAYENFKFGFVGNTEKVMPRIVKRYDGITDFTQIREQFPEKNDGQNEGFVVRFREPYEGVRIKLKYKEYFSLARILTAVSTRSIHEFLRDRKDFSVLIDNTPDEFYDWIRIEREKIENAYWDMANEAKKLYMSIYDPEVDSFKGLLSEEEEVIVRKAFADKVLTLPKKWRGLVFAQYNNHWNVFEEAIWKKIEPEYRRAFLNPLEGMNENSDSSN